LRVYTQIYFYIEKLERTQYTLITYIFLELTLLGLRDWDQF